MFRLLRIIAGFAIGAAGVYFLFAVPYTQNLAEKRVSLRTARGFQSTTIVAVQSAKENLEELRRYRNSVTRDAEYYALIAANYRLLNAAVPAIEAYVKAVEIEERPELYLYLGTIEWQVGRREAAIAHLARAVRFSDKMLEEIGDPELRAAVAAAGGRR
ncbi:MAG TPA: hypothetical protein VGE86_09465 [Thermoanaerobaculia bacterium]